MPEDDPAAGWNETGMEVTDLPEVMARRSESHAAGVRVVRALWAWRRLVLGLLLVALVVAALRTLLADGQLPGGLYGAAHAPGAVVDPTETVSAALPPLPTPPLTAPTPLPGVAGTPALGSAPASCADAPAPLSAGAPPFERAMIGQSPVLLGGFVGPYPTIPLGSAATTVAYSWRAPYSVYGWPAPIGLVLRKGMPPGPVMLSGRDVRTGHPLWFGFITAGQWGPPMRVMPGFTFDPADPPVPAGGVTNEEVFWYGYAFLPGAGCYVLAATWPGGAWHVTVSAGAISGAG